MPRQYESASLPEKALGKLHQHSARLMNKTRCRLSSAQPVVSICFDDFPETAATNGAAILQQAGVRGTFYTCFGALGQEGYGGRLAHFDQVQAVHEAGHEIGCHTYNHVNASFNPAKAFKQACENNIKAADAFSINLLQFSYPEGGMSLFSKRLVKHHYQSARSGFWGINTGDIDIFCLLSIPFYLSSLQKIGGFIDEIAAVGGWLILYTHDVSDNPSPHGISRQALENLLADLQKRNIPVKPVGQVMESMHAL